MQPSKQYVDAIVVKDKAKRLAQRAKENERRERKAARIMNTVERKRYNARVILPIRNGCAFVISDQHYDPQEGSPSPAHKAAVYLAMKLKPYAIVNNGDTLDLAAISRWPVGSYSELGARPNVLDEISISQKRLADFERFKFVAYRTHNLGNHDARFETRLADRVPEYADVKGFSLKEHFPAWMPAWRTDFAENKQAVPEVVIKHRFKGGVYAAHNNALAAGTNMVTGHDHRLYAMPITDVRGIHWGMDAGTLAPVDSRLFVNYTEDNPQNWQSGFLILWFENGKFTGPELVYALPDGRVLFRGKDLVV